MIGAAMMPSTVTAAPTMPVAIANTAEVTMTTMEREPRRGAKARHQRLNEPCLLGDEAHEDEQRHRREQLLLHHADGLEVRQVEHHVAEGEVVFNLAYFQTIGMMK